MAIWNAQYWICACNVKGYKAKGPQKDISLCPRAHVCMWSGNSYWYWLAHKLKQLCSNKQKAFELKELLKHMKTKGAPWWKLFRLKANKKMGECCLSRPVKNEKVGPCCLGLLLFFNKTMFLCFTLYFRIGSVNDKLMKQKVSNVVLTTWF